MSNVAEVYVARTAPHAHMLVSMLSGHGIEASVVGGALHGGEVPATHATAPQIWVSKKDADRAREILLKHEGQSTPARPAWECPQCREVVDGGFEICWNCEHEAPQLNAAE